MWSPKCEPPPPVIRNLNACVVSNHLRKLIGVSSSSKGIDDCGLFLGELAEVDHRLLREVCKDLDLSPNALFDCEYDLFVFKVDTIIAIKLRHQKDSYHYRYHCRRHHHHHRSVWGFFLLINWRMSFLCYLIFFPFPGEPSREQTPVSLIRLIPPLADNWLIIDCASMFRCSFLSIGLH